MDGRRSGLYLPQNTRKQRDKSDMGGGDLGREGNSEGPKEHPELFLADPSCPSWQGPLEPPRLTWSPDGGVLHGARGLQDGLLALLLALISFLLPFGRSRLFGQVGGAPWEQTETFIQGLKTGIQDTFR